MLQQDSFTYFVHKTNRTNGLVLDKSREGWPASIAAVGFALAAYPSGVESGFMARDDAVQRTLTTLRFFANAPHGPDPDATGHKGFYYHFLDMNSGQRAWRSELSSVDTAFLLAGMLAAAYYQQQTAEEDEIRKLADALYQRADWQWMQNGEGTRILQVVEPTRCPGHRRCGSRAIRTLIWRETHNRTHNTRMRPPPPFPRAGMRAPR